MKRLKVLLVLFLVTSFFVANTFSIANGVVTSAKTEQGALGVNTAADQHATTSIVTVTPTDQKAVQKAATDDLPPAGATLLQWLKWFIGIIGFSTIVRLLFRFIPSAANIDWIGKLISILDTLLGSWIPNRNSIGGTHTD